MTRTSRSRGVHAMLRRNSRSVVVLSVAAAVLIFAILLGFLYDNLSGMTVADREDILYDMRSFYRTNLFVFALFVIVAVLAVRAAARTYRQAIRLGLARAEVLRGSAAYFALVAGVVAVITVIMQAIERATAGFGIGMFMFDVAVVGRTPLWTLLQTSVLMIMLLVLLASAEAVRHRTGSLLAAAGVVIGVFLAGMGVYFVASQSLDGHQAANIARVMTVVVSAAGAFTWFRLLRRASVD